MRKIIKTFTVLSAIVLIYFTSCQKPENDLPQQINNTQIVARKGGNGNGKGKDTVTTPDTLLSYCGITLSDTGSWYPTVQINNLRWSKLTRYNYDPNTGTNSYPTDNLIINFDPVTITGKTVNCYMLLADQCQGRVACSKSNGLYLSQVTTCNSTTQFCLPIGVTWLSPYVQTYTGVIMVGTTDGCLFYGQPFSFEPPRILSSI